MDEKNVDPDQLASAEASWSWSTLFSEKIIEKQAFLVKSV